MPRWVKSRFIFSISRAVAGLFIAEKFSGRTYTMVLTLSTEPCPSAVSLRNISSESSRDSRCSSTMSLRSTIGRICNQYIFPFDSPPCSILPANSISIGRHISLWPVVSMKSTALARGNTSCFKMLLNVTTRRPSPNSLSRSTLSR